ncbi:YHS domain-containing (seleno)protein [Aliiroseovarius sp. 2305UL8-7]|uniref:YHS domain-containing (seleno)protein n=1 Tax=Aliiroseovarius conchicola TaxID=3121637 RepID=UPI003527D9FD
MSEKNYTRRLVLTGLIATPLAAGLFGTRAMAATSAVYIEDGVAWDGYDPVAYFTVGEPTPGSKDYAFDYNGVTVLFSNSENRDLFAADPMKYAPQYGGYCAYAMSKGYIAPTIPEAWTIYDDKLYLNFSLRARELWSEDIPGNIVKGDKNWPGILSA